MPKISASTIMTIANVVMYVQLVISGFTFYSQIESDSVWSLAANANNTPNPNIGYNDEIIVLLFFLIAQLSILGLMVIGRFVGKRILKLEQSKLPQPFSGPAFGVTSMFWLPISFVVVSLNAKAGVLNLGNSFSYSSAFQSLTFAAFVSPGVSAILFNALPAVIPTKKLIGKQRAIITAIGFIIWWAIVGTTSVLSFGYLRRSEAEDNNQFSLTTRQNLLIAAASLAPLGGINCCSIFIDFKGLDEKAGTMSKLLKKVARFPLFAISNAFVIAAQFYVYWSNWTDCTTHIPFNYCTFQRTVIFILAAMYVLSQINNYFILGPVEEEFFTLLVEVRALIAAQATQQEQPQQSTSATNLPNNA